MSPRVYTHAGIKALLINAPKAIHDMDLLRAALIDQFPNLLQRVEILYLVARFQAPSRIQSDPGNLQLLNREIQRLAHETGLSPEFLAPAVYSWAKGLGGNQKIPRVRGGKEDETSLEHAISRRSLTEWDELDLPESVLEPRYEQLDSILHDTFPNNQGIKERMLFLHRAGSLQRLKKNRLSLQDIHRKETERLHRVYRIPKPWLRAGLDDALQWFGFTRVSTKNAVLIETREQCQSRASDQNGNPQIRRPEIESADAVPEETAEVPALSLSSGSWLFFSIPLMGMMFMEMFGGVVFKLLYSRHSVVPISLLLFQLLALFHICRACSILKSKGYSKGALAAFICCVPFGVIGIPLLLLEWPREFNKLNFVNGWGLPDFNPWAAVSLTFVFALYLSGIMSEASLERASWNSTNADNRSYLVISVLFFFQIVYGNMAIRRANAIKAL
ncbi:hypothetical protein OAN47_02745 [Planctomycetota bacterium]|nr:hypothetical protein [Planctomycetota bacterium]